MSDSRKNLVTPELFWMAIIMHLGGFWKRKENFSDHNEMMISLEKLKFHNPWIPLFAP